MFILSEKKNFLNCVLTIFLLTFFFISCASTSNNENEGKKSVIKSKSGRPEWVSVPNKGADENLYLCAVGSGKDNTAAESSAIAAMGKIIKQDVSASSMSFESDSVSSNGDSEYTSSIDEIIETQTMIDALVGVKIKEFFEDEDGIVYALAILNRDDATLYYSKKILDNDEIIAKYIEQSETELGNFQLYGALQKAVSLAEENQNYLDILFAVNKSAYATTKLSYDSIQELKELAFNYANSLTVDIVITGANSSRAATAFSTVLAQMGFKPNVADSSSGAFYILEGSVVFEPVDSDKNAYVRYIIDVALKEASTGKSLLPYAKNAREGHKTASGAEQRAVREMEKAITEEFAKAFTDFLQN